MLVEANFSVGADELLGWCSWEGWKLRASKSSKEPFGVSPGPNEGLGVTLGCNDGILVGD